MAESAVDRLSKRLAQRRATDDRRRRSAYTLLIVDDEKPNLDALVSILSQYYQVEAFQSAEQALEAIRNGPAPDLVLTDQRMPGMTGVELLEQVQELYPDTVRLILSGYTDPPDVLEAINRGHVQQYLTKPWHAPELLVNIAHALENYQLRRERQEVYHKLEETNQQLAHLNSSLEDEVEKQGVDLHDASERLRRAVHELKRLALTDDLTGLHNRRFLDDYLTRELHRAVRYQSPISVIMADVDQFKEYNDRNGHQAGDQALQVIAILLHNTLREPDVVVRYGGEEFIAILPQTAPEGAMVAAERMRQAIRSHEFPGDKAQIHGRLTLSFGVAGLGANELNTPHLMRIRPADLIDLADKALYRSKLEGRDRVTRWETVPIRSPSL
jgi:two-component system, cell cycle response regulator